MDAPLPAQAPNASRRKAEIHERRVWCATGAIITIRFSPNTDLLHRQVRRVLTPWQHAVMLRHTSQNDRPLTLTTSSVNRS